MIVNEKVAEEVKGVVVRVRGEEVIGSIRLWSWSSIKVVELR
jgi:hypothetical protein